MTNIGNNNTIVYNSEYLPILYDNNNTWYGMELVFWNYECFTDRLESLMLTGVRYGKKNRSHRK